MVASVLQVVVGFSGLIGFLMRFIGPLTIAPTVSLIGLSLYDSAGDRAGSHWGISAMTTVLIVLFSQYLCRVPLPIPTYSRTRKLHTSKFYIFQIMPILLGISVSWLVCYLLTIYDVLPSDPDKYGYVARTDVKGDVLDRARGSTSLIPVSGGCRRSAWRESLACWLGSCARWRSLWATITPVPDSPELLLPQNTPSTGASAWRGWGPCWPEPLGPGMGRPPSVRT
ncbi:hypothetical protein NQD34_018080 [Periophthalmus magnuspinnatus]|nr:hypothetical protein NQD34_018080 [Periophthalmus magnuspinnatus]